MRKKKILVTGAYGFLGRHVARCMGGSGDKIAGIGHGAWGVEEQSSFNLSFWHAADITLDALVTYADEPDVIVHCAGSGSVAFSMLHPYQDYARTVTSTASVLEYIRLHSPRTLLVYPSSAAVHGVVGRLPIHESDPLMPASPYGAHKLMAEQMCRSYATSYGVAVAVVRFFSIYGEGLKKQLLWDACNKLANKDVAFFGTGAELRDWIHVDDAARLIQQAVMHAASSCPVVNGGSGEQVTVQDILSELFQAFGTSLNPSFSGTQRPGDPPGYQADIKAAAKWGWTPRIHWRDGVHRYVNWFKGAAK